MDVVISLGITLPARSQEPENANTIRPSGIQLVKTGLYMISGGGQNALLRLSGNGLILVDGNIPDDSSLQTQIKKISSQPVRALILTGDRGPLAGGTASAVKAGARIIVNENLKFTPYTVDPSGAKVSAATITYDSEYTLHLGGVEARVMHFGSAHTNAESVVYFPNLRTIAVGDLFTSFPEPDFSEGGSLVGWSGVLAAILRLDFDVVVPRHGPVVTRMELEGFQKRVDLLIDRAIALVKKGVPKNRLIAELKAQNKDWPINLTGDPLDRFYAELETAGAAPGHVQ